MNINQENFSDLYKKSRTILPGLHLNNIEGRIVTINPTNIIVDVGLKTNVTIFENEFFPKDINIKEGQTISFWLEQIETNDGETLLNYKKYQKNLQRNQIWNILRQKAKNNRKVEGITLTHFQQGYTVGIAGFVAFMIAPGWKKKLGSIGEFSIRKLKPGSLLLKRFKLKKKKKNKKF